VEGAGAWAGNPNIAPLTSKAIEPLIPNEVFGSDKAPPFIAAAQEYLHPVRGSGKGGTGYSRAPAQVSAKNL
jgi:hypothetical protein